MNTAKIYIDTEFTSTAWSNEIVQNKIASYGKIPAQNPRLQQQTMKFGGNPGAYSLFQISGDRPIVSSPKEIIVNIKNINLCSCFDPKKSGPVEYIDFYCDLHLYRSNPESQLKYTLIVLQDGIIYQSKAEITLQLQNRWVGYTISNIKSEHFVNIDFDPSLPSSSSSKVNPDFSSSGSSLQFGFGINVTSRGEKIETRTGIDNWKVLISHKQLAVSPDMAQYQEMSRKITMEKQEIERLSRQLENEKARSDRELMELRLRSERDQGKNVSSPRLVSSGESINNSRAASPLLPNQSDNCYLDIVKKTQKKLQSKEKERETERKSLEEAKQLVSKLNTELSSIREALRETEAQLLEKQSLLKEEVNMRQELEQILSAESENSSTEKSKLKQQIVDKQNEIAVVARQCTQHVALISQLQESAAATSEELSTLRQEVESLRVVKELRDSEVALQAEEISRLKEIESTTNSALSSANEQLQESRSSVEDLTDQLYKFESIERDNVHLQKQIKVLEDTLCDVQNKYEEQLENAREHLTDKIKDLVSQLVSEQNSGAEKERQHTREMESIKRSQAAVQDELKSALETSGAAVSNLSSQLRSELEETKRLEEELRLEREMRKKMEAEFEQERLEKRVSEEASARMLVGLVEDMRKMKAEMEEMKAQLVVEVDLKTKAEVALRQLEDLFDVSSNEEEQESHEDFVKIKG